MEKKVTMRQVMVITILCILYSSSGFAQAKERAPWLNRQVRRLLHDTTSAVQPSLTIYPTLAYAPETGLEIGASILKLFRAKNDSLNRLSELQAFAFFTFNAQYGLWLDNAIYSDKEKWFILGRTRIQRFPMFYYGIGPAAVNENHAVVDGFNIVFKQRVLRKLFHNIFIGPEVDLQSLSNVSFRQPSQGSFELPTGSDGSTNLGVGGALVYDNRHNVLNVRKGLFGELAFLHYRSSLKGNVGFNSINVDIRSFQPIGKRNVLAMQAIGMFQTGDIPFNQLALMGGDMMMRGFYTGRYRDKNMIALQAEFRMLPFSFSKRLGASLFAGSAVVSPKPAKMSARNLRASGGIGLRYLLFPKKDIYLRFDIGYSSDGFSYYVFNGEAF